MFPFRENPVEACRLSIEMLKTYESILDRINMESVLANQKEDEIIKIYDFLRNEIFHK